MHEAAHGRGGSAERSQPRHARWVLRGRPPVVEAIVRGELDLATVPALRGEVARLTGDRAGTVFCDLGEVTFADSQLVHWLLGLHRERERAGGALVVSVRPGSAVERLLWLVGADDELVVVSEPDRARPL